MPLIVRRQKAKKGPEVEVEYVQTFIGSAVRVSTDGQTDGRTDATKYITSLASRSIITDISLWYKMYYFECGPGLSKYVIMTVILYACHFHALSAGEIPCQYPLESR